MVPRTGLEPDRKTQMADPDVQILGASFELAPMAGISEHAFHLQSLRPDTPLVLAKSAHRESPTCVVPRRTLA
ncbi:hypothetical protein HCU01_20130 [Halomonas cupida]|uniref:Dihydrouridine synthase (Dus) n=1 Tax=Halomonas cupida TaxID=44933 RepID=A0ABQ0WJK2_9GAMM|nr:hypothetical protein HCU01_20130 [Halomonas cupida]